MFSLTPAAAVLLLALAGYSDDSPGESITVDSALVTLIEQAEVPARHEGVLASVEVREGSLVETGAVLARIDDTQPALSLEQARIEFDIAARQAKNELRIRLAQKTAEVAQMEHKRALESVEKYRKSVSATEIDRLRLAAERAGLEVEQAVFEHETAELTRQQRDVERRIAEHGLERHRIVAPIAGVVVQVNRHPGEWVQPGQSVLRLVRVDRLRVEAFVSVAKLPGDVSGRRAVLRVDLPGKGPTEFEGQITFVTPEVNPVNHQVRVWAEVENRDLLLKPGLQGRLAIGPAKSGKPAGKQVLARPSAAGG